MSSCYVTVVHLLIAKTINSSKPKAYKFFGHFPAKRSSLTYVIFWINIPRKRIGQRAARGQSLISRVSTKDEMRVSDDEKCYIDFWIRIIFVWKSHQIIFLYSVQSSAFPFSLVSVWVGRFIFVSSFLTLPKEKRLLSKPCLIPLMPERWARREIVHISFKSRESLPTLSDTRRLSSVDSISKLLANYAKIYDAVAQVKAQSTRKSSQDASGFLHGMGRFQFIISAVLTQHVLGIQDPSLLTQKVIV